MLEVPIRILNISGDSGTEYFNWVVGFATTKARTPLIIKILLVIRQLRQQQYYIV